MTVVRIGPDADTRNCLRVFVDGEQWCKVYAFTAEGAAQRASIVKAALELALKDPNQGELPLKVEPIAPGPYVDYRCNPVRMGQDQYRCTYCSVVWDTDETCPCPHQPNTK